MSGETRESLVRAIILVLVFVAIMLLEVRA